MLNPFPEILFLQAYAPLLIRITVGVFFIIFGAYKIRGDRHGSYAIFEKVGIISTNIYVQILGIAQIIVGAFLIVGLTVQIVAMVSAIIALVSFIIKLRHPEKLPHMPAVYILLFVMSLSLILTGAGIPAVDLPL